MTTPDQAPRGVVLAAGASRRMGAPKALLRWRGEPLVVHAVRPLLEAGLAEVVVVVGAWPQVAEAVPPPARAVTAADWAQGMRASLRAGLRAVGPGPVILTHVDRPGVQAETVRALLQAPGGAAAPVFEGRSGHPVRLPQALRARLLRADDTPLRDLLGPLTLVPVTDASVHHNVNLPADLAKIAQVLGES